MGSKKMVRANKSGPEKYFKLKTHQTLFLLYIQTVIVCLTMIQGQGNREKQRYYAK